MKLNYFDQDKVDDDIQLKMSIQQGYVPSTCRLAGIIVLSEINLGNDPCAGCTYSRDICKGRPATKSIHDNELNEPAPSEPSEPMKLILDDPPMRQNWID